MRKLTVALTLILMSAAVTGCSEKPSQETIIPEQPIYTADIYPTATTTHFYDSDPDQETNVYAEDGYLDLTTMSSTMVYSEVYNMMISPQLFEGLTIKMEGTFSYYYDEATDKEYFACIIQDATACCSQGIEFELSGDVSYPDDYPEPGQTVCVEGTFDTYYEAGFPYCILRNAVICES